VRYATPQLLPVGDAALLIEFGDEISLDINRRVHALASLLAADPPVGLGEAVPTYRSLLLHYDPLRLNYDEVEALALDALSRVKESPPLESRVIEIPTCYGGEFGPDLDFVAQHHRLRPEEVIQWHSSTLYPVYMLGFSPGFAYLGGLPAAIATPRLPTPRTSVPAGSVGIAGEQTGIYPVSTPGGWQLVGRTPLRLFDPHRDPPTLLRPGDQIRFMPTNPDRFAALWEQAWASATPEPAGGKTLGFEVLEAGILTTVQDLGRRGCERFGVPVAGAMDAYALQVANLLVGNSPGTAGLEINTPGLVLRATTSCLVAAAGAELGLRVNGQPIPNWMSAFVRPGRTVEFAGRRSGCRAYLAIAGGIDVPMVMDSRSTYLRGKLGGLGGRALRAGDWLPVRPVDWSLLERAARRLPAELIPSYRKDPMVEVIMGPQADAFSPESREILLSETYRVTPAADRMGYRLKGAAVAHQRATDIVSDGMVMGAIQVPADQQPIVMMADRQTTGGYPKIATVVSADLPLLAQCIPGESSIRFQMTTVQKAQSRYRKLMDLGKISF